jgi:glycosyltransferase involved in cell wall biosynthesis
VVPLPVDTSTYCPDPALRARGRRELSIDAGSFVVGYTGKLVEEKGLHALWSAFEALAREHENTHLVLLGGGPLLGELREAAREAGLEDRLHVPGVVHNAALPAYLNALDVFVLPSETRRNWREQFGRAVVEAMACGVPVVASDSGEIPNVVGDAGLIFREGDVVALTEKLRRLLCDRAIRAHLAQQGRQRTLDRYSLECVVEQHLAMYAMMCPSAMLRGGAEC